MTRGTDADLRLLDEQFRLEGENLIRVSTGKVVKQNFNQRDTHVSVRGRGNMLYHRIKFYLAHGFMPPTVDHIDRDPTNCSLANLRAASQNLQAHNRAYKRVLPRGVCRTTRGKPFGARVGYKGRLLHLGTFDTVEEASQTVEAKLREIYGNDYSQP